MMRKVAALAAFSAFFSLAGCSDDIIAPGEKRGPMGATEHGLPTGWEATWTELGGETCAKTITDSIRHDTGDGEIAITWWQAACGDVQCFGKIVGYVDLRKEASEEGSCSDGTRTLPFIDTL